MYRCGICRDCSQPKQGQQRHVIYRDSPNHPGKEILREIPICDNCSRELGSGRKTLEELRREFAPKYVPDEEVPTVLIAPPPKPVVIDQPIQIGRVVEPLKKSWSKK